MASKSENAEIAVLQSQMEDVKTSMGTLSTKVDSVITKLDAITLVQTEINGLKAEIADLKKAKFRNGVIYPSLAAIAGAVIAALIVLTITGVK